MEMYDLKLSQRHDSMISSQAISCIRWIKETDISKTILAFIIRDGPRNVGFFYSCDAADRPRRFYWIDEDVTIGLLGCNVTWSCKYIPTFWRNILLLKYWHLPTRPHNVRSPEDQHWCILFNFWVYKNSVIFGFIICRMNWNVLTDSWKWCSQHF
jgi:hypothetical protein